MAKRFTRNAIDVNTIKDVDPATSVAGDMYVTKDNYVYLFNGQKMVKLAEHGYLSNDGQNFSDIDFSQLAIGDTVIVGDTVYTWNGKNFLSTPYSLEAELDVTKTGSNTKDYESGKFWLRKNGTAVTVTYDFTTINSVSSSTIDLPEEFKPITSKDILVYTTWRSAGKNDVGGEGTKYVKLSNGKLVLSNLTGKYNHTGTFSYVTK